MTTHFNMQNYVAGITGRPLFNTSELASNLKLELAAATAMDNQEVRVVQISIFNIHSHE